MVNEIEAECPYCGLVWADYDYEDGENSYCPRCSMQATFTIVGGEEE